MSDMVGVWDEWNTVEEPIPYTDTETYDLGAAWLEPCELVEDWGCGRGWLRTKIPAERYRGIDGSGPYADVTADLRTYRSRVPGIFMRHVLEHNQNWQRVLDNAVESFTQRMALVVFTPFAETTHVLAVGPLGVPDISFAWHDLTFRMWDYLRHHEVLETDSQYETETIFYLEKR